MKVGCVFAVFSSVALAVQAGCGGPVQVQHPRQPPGPSKACSALELQVPGYESAPIASEFTAMRQRLGPSGERRTIVAGQVYQRVRVQQFGGTRDPEPPQPTLISFEFVDGTNQLKGQYCVVQVKRREAAEPVVHGHYPVSFAPLKGVQVTPAHAFFVDARLRDSQFEIGFDGDAANVTIYVEQDDATIVETYAAVPIAK